MRKATAFLIAAAAWTGFIGQYFFSNAGKSGAALATATINYFSYFTTLSNLYIVLKTGWSFGVTITAGILAFVIFQLGKKLGLVKTEFGMLENNAMQSVASAAGYMTGGGTVAAIPGLMYLTHSPVPAHQIFVWITALAFLGVFVAIPMKRQMINQEQLRFPSGIAAAATLRSLHPEHAGEEGKPSEGEIQAKALLWAPV